MQKEKAIAPRKQIRFGELGKEQEISDVRRLAISALRCQSDFAHQRQGVPIGSPSGSAVPAGYVACSAGHQVGDNESQAG